MLIVFCVERPSEEGVPLGGRIELCGTSSCLGGFKETHRKKVFTHHKVSSSPKHI